jgi:hypothetical protein
LSYSCDDGTTNFTWADNSDQLRVSTNSAHIGTTSGTVIGTQTSDERLKEICPGFRYGLDTILKLKPVEYTLKDDPDKIRKLGFGAQSTRSILPEAVYDSGINLNSTDKYTKLMMDYHQIMPVVVKGFQELNERVILLEKMLLSSKDSKI